MTRPDGQTIGFAYDTMGRLDTVAVPGGEIGYVYDATTGNLKNIIAVDGGALTYGYDGSLLTSVAWAGTIAGSVGYGYDNNFRLTTLKVNDTDPVAYGYDRDSLLTQAGAMTLNHDPLNGQLKGTTLGNVTDSYTYNEFGEVTDYAAQYNGSDLYRAHQDYDKLGRITSKTETVDRETHTYVYGYDTAGRLTDVTKDGVLISHYDYDDNGNRLAHVSPGGTAYGSYDDQDRLLSYDGATYEYTANGELLRKTDSTGTTSYVYDVLGNLTKVTLPDGTVIDYVIDGQNRRVGKKVNGVLVQGFLYQDGLEPVAELDGNGNVVARFVYGAQSIVPDYMVKDGVTYEIVSDYLGSPRLVVNSATGQVIQRLDYDEFGKAILDTNPGFQPFGFAGGVFERQTGLANFGTRDYIPSIGRWAAKDTIGFRGGINNYSYVANDPINFNDPSGKYTSYAHAAITRMANFTVILDSDKLVAANVNADNHDDPEYNMWGHYDMLTKRGDQRDDYARNQLNEAIRLWICGNYDDAYNHLGRGLHAIQDKYAHKGIYKRFPWMHGVGRAFRHDIDEIRTDPEAAYGAYLESKHYLDEFKDKVLLHV